MNYSYEPPQLIAEPSDRHVGQLTQCLVPTHRAYAWEYSDEMHANRTLFGACDGDGLT